MSITARRATLKALASWLSQLCSYAQACIAEGALQLYAVNAWVVADIRLEATLADVYALHTNDGRVVSIQTEELRAAVAETDAHCEQITWRFDAQTHELQAGDRAPHQMQYVELECRRQHPRADLLRFCARMQAARLYAAMVNACTKTEKGKPKHDVNRAFFRFALHYEEATRTETPGAITSYFRPTGPAPQVAVLTLDGKHCIATTADASMTVLVRPAEPLQLEIGQEIVTTVLKVRRVAPVLRVSIGDVLRLEFLRGGTRIADVWIAPKKV